MVPLRDEVSKLWDGMVWRRRLMPTLATGLLRRATRRSDDLLQRVESLKGRPVTAPTALRVAIHGGARFHRPTCPLVVGKRTTARIGTKRIPCEACRP